MGVYLRVDHYKKHDEAEPILLNSELVWQLYKKTQPNPESTQTGLLPRGARRDLLALAPVVIGFEANPPRWLCKR